MKKRFFEEKKRKNEKKSPPPLSIVSTPMKQANKAIDEPAVNTNTPEVEPPTQHKTLTRRKLPSQAAAEKEGATYTKEQNTNQDQNQPESEIPGQGQNNLDGENNNLNTSIAQLYDLQSIPDWVKEDETLQNHWLEQVKNQPILQSEYIPEEIYKEGSLSTQVWNDLEGDELRNKISNLHLTFSSLAENTKNHVKIVNEACDKEEKLLDKIDEEVNQCHARLPDITQKRLKLCKYANNPSLSYDNLDSGSGAQQVLLGTNALKNTLSQLIQPNINNVILSLKEILAYFSREVAVTWLARNTSLLFCGINYQLKRFSYSEILTASAKESEPENNEPDPNLIILELLTMTINHVFNSEIILTNTPISDIKDSISHIFKIFQKEVNPKFLEVQNAFHNIVKDSMIKNERTFLYAIAAIVCLFKEYCSDAVDICDDHISKTLKRLLVRLNHMSKSVLSQNTTIGSGPNGSGDTTKTTAQIIVTKHGQEACLKELDSFYSQIPDPKLNQKCYKNEHFKMVGTLYYLLVEANTSFWKNALDNNVFLNAAAARQIAKFIKGVEKKRLESSSSRTTSNESDQSWLKVDNQDNMLLPQDKQEEDVEESTNSRNTSLEDSLKSELLAILKEITNRNTTEKGLQNLYSFKQKNATVNADLDEMISDHLGADSPLKSFIDMNLQNLQMKNSSKSSELGNKFLESQVTTKQLSSILNLDLPTDPSDKNSDPLQKLKQYGINKNINWSEYNCLPFDKSKILKFPDNQLSEECRNGGVPTDTDIEIILKMFGKVSSRGDKIYKELGSNFSISGENKFVEEYFIGKKQTQNEQLKTAAGAQKMDLSKTTKNSQRQPLSSLDDINTNFKMMTISTSEPNNLSNKNNFSSKNRNSEGQKGDPTTDKQSRLAELRNRYKNLGTTGSKIGSVGQGQNDGQVKNNDYYRQRLEDLRRRK